MFKIDELNNMYHRKRNWVSDDTEKEEKAPNPEDANQIQEKEGEQAKDGDIDTSLVNKTEKIVVIWCCNTKVQMSIIQQ